MKFIFLTEQFYDDYKMCLEIEKKSTRPYAQVHIEINNLQFAIPLRSGISHKQHVLWTNKEEKCGLDFSKSVVIVEDKYISKIRIPYIRPIEFNALRGKEHIVKQKLIKHIYDYKKAKSNQSVERNRLLCQFSTMQYFEEYIEIIDMNTL